MPPRHRFAARSDRGGPGGRERGGRGGGGGVHHKVLHKGRVGLGGRRPDPGLLVPDASRQEAEANFMFYSGWPNIQRPSNSCRMSAA